MQRQEPNPRKPHRNGDSFSHRIGNVVEFKIEENIGARVRELLNGSRTFGSKKLATDFEEADRFAKLSR
jgi:hypothetical protein